MHTASHVHQPLFKPLPLSLPFLAFQKCSSKVCPGHPLIHTRHRDRYRRGRPFRTGDGGSIPRLTLLDLRFPSFLVEFLLWHFAQKRKARLRLFRPAPFVFTSSISWSRRQRPTLRPAQASGRNRYIFRAVEANDNDHLAGGGGQV